MADSSRKLFHLQILDEAKKYESEVALIDGNTGDSITYAQLREKSYRFANALKLLGANKSDIICVILENCPEYAIVFLGSALIGCTISGINPDSTFFEIENYVKLTSSKFILSSADHYETLKGFAGKICLILIDKDCAQQGYDFSSIIRKSELDYNFHEYTEINFDDTLITPFSSGTTDSPKCVELTHRNYNTSTESLKKAVFDQLSGGDRRTTIAVLPFYHGSGFWALCFCLLEGHKTITLAHFRPSIMFHCIDEYKIDTLNVVPAIINYLSTDNSHKKWNLSSVKTVLCGSAPLGKESSKRFLEIFTHVTDLIQGYGMTEVVVLSHITPLGTQVTTDKYLGSCGKLLPGFDAKLINEDTGKEIKKPYERGELLLKSDAVMKGYFNDDKVTKAAIDPDGWLHTGDVLYYDEQGFYFVVDRIKDLIKVNGLQVSPSELEDLLLTHPKVTDAAVVGVPDKNHGEIPRAFVVLNDHMNECEPEDIVRFVNANVSRHKQLRGGVRIVDSLPKTSSGKVIRKELKKKNSMES